MAPPTGISATCDNTPIDLGPLKQFPKIETLPAANQQNPEIQQTYGFMKMVIAADTSGDGKIDNTEADIFVKKIRNPDPNAPQMDACTFMSQLRLFIGQDMSKIKTALTQAPDLSPANLSDIKALPELDKFPEIIESDMQDPALLKSKLEQSALSAPFKELMLKNPQVFLTYFKAQRYLTYDLDKDASISLEDCKKLIPLTQDTEHTPESLLSQIKQDFAETAMLAMQLKQGSNADDPKQINMAAFFALTKIAPDLIKANPVLSWLMTSVVSTDAEGKPTVVPELMDGFLTVEELQKIPGAADAIKAEGGDPQKVFDKLKLLSTALYTLPINLWPSDLQDMLDKSRTALMINGEEQAAQMEEAMGGDLRERITRAQDLSPEYRRVNFTLGMIETINEAKFQQEKMDHAGTDGSFISGVTWLFSAGHFSWNKHFQEERPKAHKDARDAAIADLKTTLREQHIEKLEDAITYMDGNGKSASVKVLNAELDLPKWIEISKSTKDVERNQKLLDMARSYREGEYKFWEFPLLPAPRLGKGGWVDRALNLTGDGPLFSNWTLKSPELLSTLSLDNYIAGSTVNLFALKNKPGTEFLVSQFDEAQQKTFNEFATKIGNGDAIDASQFTAFVDGTSLSDEGKKELKFEIEQASTLSANSKRLQEATLQAELQKLTPDQIQKLEPYLQNLVQSSVQGEEIVPEIIRGTLQQEGFPKSLIQAVEDVAKNFGKVNHSLKPASGLEVLFREAGFSDLQEAKRLFSLATPSDFDKAAFNTLVATSKLSSTNQATLVAAFTIQPNHKVAEAARDEYMAILGDPKRNPITLKYDESHVGGLRTSIRVTADRGVGLVALGAPTFVGGAFGNAFFKGIRAAALTPVAEMSLFQKVTGGAVWNAAGNTPFLRRMTGNFNPVLGSAIFAGLGTVFTVSPYGEDLRKFAGASMSMPFYHWSDAEIMDMPRSATGMYLDFAASMQGMDAAIMGLKGFGSLELGSRIANTLKIPPGIGSMGSKAMGLLKGAGSKFFGKTESQVIKETLEKAKLEGVPWAADVPALATAERIWAKAEYERVKASVDTARSFFGQTTPQAARIIEIQDTIAATGKTMGWADRAVLEREIAQLSAQLPEHVAKRLIGDHLKMRSLEILGKVGPNPYFSSRILRTAQKWTNEGAKLEDAAYEARVDKLLTSGANNYVNMAQSGFQNSRMGKTMIWYTIEEKMDPFMRPHNPIIPKHPDTYIPANLTLAAAPAADVPAAKKAPAGKTPKK